MKLIIKSNIPKLLLCVAPATLHAAGILHDKVVLHSEAVLRGVSHFARRQPLCAAQPFAWRQPLD
jgi:hypothetical protein